MFDMQHNELNLGSGFIQADKPLPHADHIFGTKKENGTADEIIRSLTERIGPIAHMRQVHGDRIAYVSGPGLNEECDAIFTDHKDLWLAVKSADCLPVLISTPSAVAAVHCGWRGLQAELLPNMLHVLMEEFRISPVEMFVHIGPAIAQHNYEVEDSFADIFPDKFFRESQHTGHLMLDMPALAKYQATELGVPDLNIHNSDMCTFDHADQFHSYRRAKQEKDESYRVQLSMVRRKSA